MATNTSNSSMNDMTGFTRLPSSHCIAWVVVLIVESLLIVILNLFTIIVFATHRQLQRSGTYLIQNLAVIDLLAGGISGPLQIERIGEDCDIWEYPVTFDPAFFVKFALLHIFSFASLGNLVAISLQRVHATFWPSRYLFLKKWVYIVIIALIWLVAAIREAAQIASLIRHSNHSELEMILNSALYISYYLIALVLISISYISIFLKIRRSPRPQQRNVVVTRERQLTSTLFIVTVVSLFTLLPVIIYVSVNSFVLSLRQYFNTRMIAVAFFLGNSLANPIIYAMKMQGVRAGLTELLTRSTSVNNAASFPLRGYRADI